MKKAIDLSVHLHIGNDPGAADRVGPALVAAFAAANPGLHLTVNRLAAPDGHGDSLARVRIEGEQEAAADFAHLAGDALHRAVAGLNAPTAPTGQAPLVAEGSPKVTIHQLAADSRDSPDDENVGVVLPPGHTIAGEQAAIAARAAAAAPPPASAGDHSGPALAAGDRAAAPSHDPAATLAAATPAPAPAPGLTEPPAQPTPVAAPASTTLAPVVPPTVAADHPAPAPAAAPLTAHPGVAAASPVVPSALGAPPAHAAPPPADTPLASTSRRTKGRKGGGAHRHSG